AAAAASQRDPVAPIALLHTQHRFFSRLDDAWRAEFGDEVELPCWADLLRSGVAIFDLDFDVSLSVMYALSVSAEGDCYRCVPPDPGIAAAALGAIASGTLPGTAPAEALHTFTLDSADPSGGPDVARSSTVLPCPAVPSGSLSGLHLPSFSTNFVSTAALQDAMVTTTTPGGQHVSICTCTRTGRHLATFTRRPGSGMYTLATEPPQVAASAQVSVSGQVPPPCSCRLLSHQTLLWHHRMGHPSLPCLRGRHSRFLVSGLPRSLPPLPPSPAPPCLPCVEGRHRAAPHSSSFPLKTAPLQTLHMDMWGPARVSGQGCKRYFLLVIDEYTRYNTVFHLRSKGQVVDVLIPWIRTVRLQLREQFNTDLPVLRLHSDRGGEFSSDLLRDYCRGEGILQSFMLPESPQQSGIAERCIGLVMEVARISMIHAAAPHFLWPSRFSCLCPRYGTSADKLSARAIPCVFLGFVPDAPGWQLYHPTSRRVLPSQDVTFDESDPFYRLFPYRSAPPPPPPLFLAPGPPPVDPLPPQGLAPSSVSQVDPPPGAVPGEVAVDSGVARGTASGGAEPGGAEPGGAGPGVCEWLVRRARLQSGASGAGGAGVPAGAGFIGGNPATGPRGARTWARGSGASGARARGVGAGGTCAGGDRVGGAGAGGAGDGGAGVVDPGGTVRPGPYFVPLLQQVLGVPSSTSLTPPLLCPPPEQSQLPLQPASPLPAPSPYTEKSGGLTDCREPASRPVLPVRTARRLPHLRPPLSPARTLWNSVPDPESDHARAASPTVSRLLATAVMDPSFESTDASALVAELLDFAAACRLDYATTLEDFECLAAAVPRFTSMLLAPKGDPDAPDIPNPRSYTEAITGPYSSQWQAATDAEMASWKSTGTYIDEFPPHGANIVDGMWIFRVKRSPGSPPAFKAHYVAWCLRQPPRGDLVALPTFTGSFPAGTQWSLWPPVYGLRQAPCEWHDTLRTTLAALGFAPSTSDPSLFLRIDISLPSFYVLLYVDDLVFATADTEALALVSRSCRRDTPALTWVLQRFGFQFSSPQPTPLSTSHSLLAQPSNESVEPSGPYPELVDCLISSCEAEIYAGAIAAQEIRWLTYLLTDLGEKPRSPPVLYQRGQLRLAHVATRANTADVFTKALPPSDHQRIATVLGLANTADIFTKALAPGDHQRFCTLLACFALLDWSCDPLFSPTLPMGVAASGQVLAAVSRSGPESAPCSCRLLSHETLLWHHRLGHPSLPRLRSMASRVLVSGLPQSLPPLPSGPGPSCVPCVEGRLRATPHSSHFPPTEAPLQTLHMDVWGPAPVRGQGYERYFLLMVDDYSRYTTVLPLRSKDAVTEVLIDWIREARLQLRKSFGSDFPVLRLHSDRGGEFSSRLLRYYCSARGIRQTFTLPDSPQQNGIAERRIGMVMDVARTSMIHAAAPHFLWPFAVRYAAHQINLHPRVSSPETSPALLWTGKVGDASAFRVWGSRAFVRDLSADKLSPRAAPCVFLGFPTDAPGWQFYHPSSRRVLSSQDVRFDESVPFYRLFPYRTPSLPPPPDFLVPVPPPVDPLPPPVPAPSGVSQVDAVDPVEVTGDSGAAAGAEPWVAASGGAVRGGAEPGGATAGGAGPEGTTAEGAETWGAEPGGAVPGGAGSGGAGPGAAEPGGAASGAAEPGVSPVAASRREPLSPQELREWFARRWRRAAEPGGAAGAGAGASSTVEGAGAAGPGAAGPAGPPGAAAAEGVGAEPAAVGPAAGGVGGAGAVAEGTGAVPAESGVAVRPRPYFVPLLQQVLGLSPPVEGPPPVQSQSLLEPSSPLPAPSPYTGPTGGLAERREPASLLTGATTSSARSFIASRYTKQDTSCEAEIYAGAMAAQELRWLTYLLTDLGEPPRSPPVLYVDNKAMLALCREQRLEHRTKHIALRYFLARELQQRGQL
ncbi:unnamed protein product, partial [Closterium sp. NIES-53]